MPLNVGPNTFTTIVTAQDGITTKTYTLIVTRPSTDATLSSLTISQGTLTPAFAAATTSYTALVGSAVSSIILTPTAHEANATIKVNGVPVASGTATGALPLSVGPNTFTTIVTAQDGITTKTYTLIVTRPSADAALSNLTISQGTLTPAFAAATTSYTALVGSSVSSIILTPTAHEANATIKVNGVTVASGTATAALTLNVGPNTFTTVVTAQDGITTKTYTLIVTRPSTDATLSSLAISQGTLTPGFAAATTSYTALVGSAVSNIILTPTAHEANATIAVNGVTVASGTATAALTLNVGPNTFTTIVTAQDGITTKTYTLIVTRPSADAALSNLTISQGTLTPVFAAATTSYTALVGSAVSSIILTPTAHEANATVKVNGVTVASGTATAALPLSVGTNTFTTIVTAQDGITTKTYTLIVTRPSTDATLSNLTISQGTLTPAFAAATTIYTALVGSAVSSIILTPTAHEANATIKVNGITVASGTATVALPLSVGTNTFTTVVTAQDGITTKTYTLIVTRPSADATLSSLAISQGTLTPAFAAATTSYTALVGSAVSSIILTPTAHEANATITVNGVTVASGTATAALTLNVGPNTFTTIVTAQDGITTKTYTLIVTRPSTDATLSSLTISQGTLTPAFAAATTSYTALVGSAVSNIILTPTAHEANAMITVNGVPIASGTATGALPLSVGPNTFTTIVTAQDGITTKTYTLIVTRPSADATLSILAISQGTLTPAFAAATTSYTALVGSAVSSIILTPTAHEANATITVNGVTVASGTATAALTLNVGPNTFTTIVTAQDGITTKTYTLIVTRSSTDAALSSLVISQGTLSPVFSPTTTSYTAQVGSAVSRMILTPTAHEANATITVNGVTVASGTATAALTLNVGPNTFTTIVTAQDGITTKTYTLIVTRPSADATLSILAISQGTLTPAFAAATTSYTALVGSSVSSIILTPTAHEANATIKVNGVTVASGTATAALTLNVGPNTFTTIVTAQDGITTKTYTLIVTRPSTDATLSNLTISQGTLTPAFAAATTSYTALVGSAVSNIILTPTAHEDNAMITVNGVPIASGTATGALPLSVGPNTFTTIVTAQDGITTKTYTLIVTRPSADATLSILAISQGTLTPAFAAATTSYTALVGSAVSSIILTPTAHEANATITVNGVTVASGTATAALTLNIGPNTFTTIVTAQDGITTKTYTLIVTRSSTDAALSGLAISQGTLSPVFSPTTTSYTAQVGSAVSSIILTPTAHEANATITVNGVPVASGTATGALPLSVGPNTFTTIVTAQDGITTKTYTLIVTRPSTDATLSSLTISQGNLTPVFSPTTTSYTALVGSAVSSIILTPTAHEANATIKVNGVTVASGTATAALTLNVGPNTFTTIITAQDGITTKSYTLIVTRPSTDATLSNLMISQGTLTPVFSPTTTSYTAQVGSAVSSIILTPTAYEANATITVNGVPVASGTATGALPLSVGPNMFTTIVTAQDGITTKTYTLIVTRPSADAALSSLAISQGTLTPVFAAATTSYTALVGSAVSSIILTPTAHEANATIKVNGVTVASGTATAALTLNIGPNMFTTIVTAQDGITTKTYTLIVTRPSADATLSSLAISQGTLTPAFAAAATSYTALVGSAVSSIILTPTTHEANATITVNGVTVASGTATAALTLNVGPNTFTTIVTAQDGITTKTYTLIVTRPSTDATLSNLTISQGTLTPVFAAATTSYTAIVGSAVSSIILTPTAHEANATIKVNGVTVASGTSTAALTLNVGPNTFTTVVTAQDGITTKTYTLIVTRPSTDATLSSLAISQGTLTPAFAATTTSYTALVGSAVSNIILTPTAHEANATITVNGVTVASGTATAALTLNVGPNTFTTIVTAQDGITTKTYTLIVTRPSADAALSSLAISTGNLTPVFSPTTTSYTALVGSAVSSIILTPTAHEANATIKVNGVTVASGTATAALTLNVGPNTFTTIVTAQDGITTKTYTLIVTRPSTDAALSSLVISQGTLTPGFAAATTSYTALVGSAVSNIILTPTAHEANATITVNGVTVASGTATAALTLNVGPNTFTTVVTAQDGITTKTYTLIVTRPSTDATLSSLAISQGTLTPVFSPTTASYTAQVGSAVSSIILTPTAHEANATIKVNGVTVASGTATAALTLNVGPNTFTTIVTAQDGITTKTYTLIVTRPSADATLSNLTISQGTLTPAFAAATTSYTALVGSAVSSIILTPTAHEANATIKVNGITVASGTATAALPLSVGTNTFTTIVTAQDGITTKTYTLIVTRPSTDATLSNLTISQGTLTPAFAAATTSYTALVGSAVSSIILTPTAHEANATIKVNGVTVASGTATAALPLSVGTNTFTTVVTAQDGITTKTYTLIVTRPSADATLSSFAISQGTLTPAFAAATTSYTALVGSAVSSIILTPTAHEANATITVNGVTVASGTATAALTLNVGPNTFTTVVTAQDGITTKTYTLIVTRPSTDATLSSLAISQGTLTPAFAAAATSYTALVGSAVSSIILTPTAHEANATITVNGVTVASGTATAALTLNVGPNTFTTIVTAQDGITTKTYTLIVTRPSTDATLSNLTISQGTLTPVFAAATTSYTAIVGSAVSSIILTPTAHEANATIKVNGVTVASGTATAALTLNVGPNTFNTVVTAQDGITTKSYTLIVTRPSANADLANLIPDNGILSPAFSAGITAYTVSVANAVSTIKFTPTTADATAGVTVDGLSVSSGSASAGSALPVGPTTITVAVTAEDGSTKIYTIIVTRALPNDANLFSLTPNAGILNPVFAAATTSYAIAVSNSTTAITLTPVTNDPAASVTVNGNTLTSGTASPSIPLVVGTNLINTVVTAQDGTTVKTYTVTVTRAPSTNADLSNLILDQGILTPVFSAGIINYTASVGNNIVSIGVTPTVSDPNSKIEIDGVSVASGSASAQIPLTVGANLITVLVIAQDGTTIKVYKVTITRAGSANADLSNVVLSAGTLSPVFTPLTLGYTEAVGNAISSITLQPSCADANATVTVNGITVPAGSISGAIPLVVGTNVITVVVTAQDGTTKTYTITVTRAGAANADLSALVPGSGILSPAFVSATLSYSASVGNTTTGITLAPTTADPNATVTVNGIAVVSGSASTSIPLTVGSNTITTVVTAQDGVTTKTYLLVVNRASGLSSNADINSLTVSVGTLSPAFAPGTPNYTETVPYGSNNVSVTPITGDASSTVTVNGIVVNSGTASGIIPLNIGATLITIKVTAQDGVTVKTYTITVTRSGPATNPNLLALTLSQGTLTPVFAQTLLNYTADVGNSVSSITVTPTTTDVNATVTVNGDMVASGTASANIALNVGPNIITVVSTAQDGLTTKTYTITVTRAAPAPSNDAELSNITISSGTLSPGFVSGLLEYTATVENNITAITVTTAAKDGNATITVNGNAVTSGSASGPINLAVGPNIITVIVTAQDGTTVRTYTVTVTRLPLLIIISNAFTPNGDGINDTWSIKSIEDFPGCTVRVFNRAGQVVYSSIGYGIPWDGSYRNLPLPAGTYYYIIDLKNGRSVMSGSVIIVR